MKVAMVFVFRSLQIWKEKSQQDMNTTISTLRSNK